MFKGISDGITSALSKLKLRGTLTAADIDAAVREIRRALLDADVNLEVVKDFCTSIKAQARNLQLEKSLNPAAQVVKIVHKNLVQILGVQKNINFAKKPPTVIMLAGLQGTGKTTFAAKLAKELFTQGHTPLLIPADLKRPGAVLQLIQMGEAAGVPVYDPGQVDEKKIDLTPVKVTKMGIDYAKRNLNSVVIVDTAGRLAVDEDLMTEIGDIKSAIDPDEIVFVMDSTMGQTALTTAQTFYSTLNFTSLVLTKLDSDAKGGAALSVAGVLNIPILYVSNGEKIDDLEPFFADRMASRILDMGDMLSLIEQAQKAFSEQEAKEAAQKLAQNTFGLDDFLHQLQQLKKSNIKKMLSLLPGKGELKNAIDSFDPKSITKTEAIIQSMTPIERKNPKILNASRRTRIARGSGTNVQDINLLITRFEQMSKMMKKMPGSALFGAKGQTMQGAGLAGLPFQDLRAPFQNLHLSGGSKPHGSKSKNKKHTKRSGNPAKRKS